MIGFLAVLRREKTGRHTGGAVVAKQAAQLREQSERLAQFGRIKRAECRTGRHVPIFTETDRPVLCPACAVNHHAAQNAPLAARVAELEARLAQYTAHTAWADHANTHAIHVPAPADAGAREVASSEETAATDVSALREEAGHLLLLASGPGGEEAGTVTDVPADLVAEVGNGPADGVAGEGNTETPTVAVPVALDAEDTLTLPVRATPPTVVVHDADGEAATRPLVSPIGLVVPVPPAGLADPAAVPRLVDPADRPGLVTWGGGHGVTTLHAAKNGGAA